MRRAGWVVGLAASFVLGPILYLGVGLLGLAGRLPAWLAHRRARILLVAEWAPYAELLAATLRRAGYRADRSHPRGALDALATGRYHIVVSGLVMPYLTGLELLAAVSRSSPRTQVILLTGDPAGETAFAALRRGALAVLDKRAMRELERWVNEAFARVFAPRLSDRGVPLLPGAGARAA
jgi:CheY-like chemotaxis protein